MHWHSTGMCCSTEQHCQASTCAAVTGQEAGELSSPTSEGTARSPCSAQLREWFGFSQLDVKRECHKRGDTRNVTTHSLKSRHT